MYQIRTKGYYELLNQAFLLKNVKANILLLQVDWTKQYWTKFIILVDNGIILLLCVFVLVNFWNVNKKAEEM